MEEIQEVSVTNTPVKFGQKYEDYKDKVPILLRKHYGNKYKTCKELGINRSTLYDWLNKYPDFAEECDIRTQMDDMAESTIYYHLEINDRHAASWYAENQKSMRSRGYGVKEEAPKTAGDIAPKEHEANRKTMEERAAEMAEEMFARKMKEFMVKDE